MKLLFLTIAACWTFLLPSHALAGADENATKDRIIAESIARYRGSCPCPDSVMRNGRRCGKRSAYSRPGGQSPICYREDVSEEMLENYKRSQK